MFAYEPIVLVVLQLPPELDPDPEPEPPESVRSTVAELPSSVAEVDFCKLTSEVADSVVWPTVSSSVELWLPVVAQSQPEPAPPSPDPLYGDPAEPFAPRTPLLVMLLLLLASSENHASATTCPGFGVPTPAKVSRFPMTVAVTVEVVCRDAVWLRLPLWATWVTKEQEVSTEVARDQTSCAKAHR